jgi:serine protease Do
MAHKLKLPIFFFALGIGAGLLIYSLIFKVNRTKPVSTTQAVTESRLSAATIKEAALIDVENSRVTSITRAVQKVSPAVVGINVIQIREFRARTPFDDDPFFRNFFPELRQRQAVKGLGSGFIISPDGYIITNEHVVHEATEIIITLPDKSKFNAVLKAADYKSDIALLKIEDKQVEFPYVALGNSDDILIGEWAIAFGNPFGLFDLGAHPSVTQGIISALDRDFGRQENERVYLDMIQTDASINGGNSGGPLANALGEVIGMNTFIYSGSETMTASIGLGFAIPINRIKQIVKDLKEYGKVNRSFRTGLEVQDLTRMIARYLGKDDLNGVIISEIENNSPAERAGLAVGDVIVEVNDTVITDTEEIWNIIENMDLKSGDMLKLKIFRNRKYFMANLKLEK